MSLKRFQLLLPILLLCSENLFAHGTTLVPISRVYNCYQEGPENPKTAACKAAVALSGPQMLYDWSSINQLPNGDHKTFVPDGQLCGGGKSLYQGLDLPRQDWTSTNISPDADGNFLFTFLAPAPHASKYFEVYITKDSYDYTTALKWSDLEDTPFCTISGFQTVNNGQYKLLCPFPKNKNGKYVMYLVWQRSDSAEAFYSCSDVKIQGQTPSPWQELGKINAAQDLPVGSTVTLRLFDSRGVDVETHSVSLSASQTALTAWPYYLAKGVNSQSTLFEVGVLNGSGSVVPVMSSTENRVYANGSSSYTFKIDINIDPSLTPTPAPSPKPAPSSTPVPSPKPVPSPTPVPSPKPVPSPTPVSSPKPIPSPTPAPVPPVQACRNVWIANKTYANPGSTVSYNKVNYQNKWWTLGDRPDTSGKWGVWRSIGRCK